MSEPMLYLCDRRACEKCSPECHHTLDIKHARNFQIGMDGKSYVETPNVLAFLKLNCGLRKQDLHNLRRMVDEQVPTGIVVLPSYVEPVIATSDGVEHPVKFCHGGIDISLAEFRKDHPELSEDEIREKYWKHDF